MSLLPKFYGCGYRLIIRLNTPSFKKSLTHPVSPAKCSLLHHHHPALISLPFSCSSNIIGGSHRCRRRLISEWIPISLQAGEEATQPKWCHFSWLITGDPLLSSVIIPRIQGLSCHVVHLCFLTGEIGSCSRLQKGRLLPLCRSYFLLFFLEFQLFPPRSLPGVTSCPIALDPRRTHKTPRSDENKAKSGFSPPFPLIFSIFSTDYPLLVLLFPNSDKWPTVAQQRSWPTAAAWGYYSWWRLSAAWLGRYSSFGMFEQWYVGN